jgi:DNA-binding transcriptional ArsR family regulator
VNVATTSNDALWAAIAEPSRRTLLDLLLAHGPATASRLAHDLPFTRQATTKHLAVLEGAGLVESVRVGREVRYSVRPERLGDASAALADAAERWDARLLTIKRLAEEAHRAG